MRLVTVALGVGGALESPRKADLASRILRDLDAFVPFQECTDSLMSAFVCSSCAVTPQLRFKAPARRTCHTEGREKRS